MFNDVIWVNVFSNLLLMCLLVYRKSTRNCYPGNSSTLSLVWSWVVCNGFGFGVRIVIKVIGLVVGLIIMPRIVEYLLG